MAKRSASAKNRSAAIGQLVSASTCCFGRFVRPDGEKNRVEFALPSDGWFKILPVGEHPHNSGIVQVVDRLAVDAIVAKFRLLQSDENFPGVLVDFDHFSHDSDKPSSAAAWIEEMDAREDGVWAKARWTDIGKAATEGGSYRLISPVLADFEPVDGGNRHRPREVTRVALTNDPNIKKGMPPVSNRGVGGASARDDSTAGNKNRDMDYKKTLCRMLGLDPSATDEEITEKAEETEMRNNDTGELEKMKAEKAALDERIKTVEEENRKLRNRQVAEAMETFKDVIKPEKSEAWKNRLSTDYDMAVEALRDIQEASKGTPPPAANGRDGKAGGQRREGAPPDPKHNRDNGQHPPDPNDPNGSGDPTVGAAWTSVANRARVLAKEHGITYNRAFQIASDEALAEGKVRPVEVTK